MNNAVIGKLTNGMKQESPETEPYMYEVMVRDCLSHRWGKERLFKN